MPLMPPPRCCRHLRLASITALAAGCATASLAAPDSESFEALGALPGIEAPALSHTASRNRLITLDLDSIAPGAVGRSLVEFALFDDAVFSATRKQVDVIEDGRWSWVGTLENDPYGVVQFAVRDGVASGVIRSTDRGVFRVRYTGEPGVYVAEEIDEANLEPCATGPNESVAHPDDIPPVELEDPGAATDRGSLTTIDLLVGYTGSARNQSGGTAGMLAEIDLAVASANLAYQNSNVDIHLNLVLTYAAQYNETNDASLDLFNWREDGDGFMDSVHDQRDDIAADMCALLVGSLNACGIANLMTSPSTNFENRAFSVTELGCAVNNLSFAHELGHNLGCAHDRDNANNGAYSYSFGYRDPFAPADWRTIMAYAPGTRIQWFSNPLIGYEGQVLGVLSGANSADNSRSMNLTRTVARDWRDASTRQPLEFNLEFPLSGANGVNTAQVFEWEANGPTDTYSFIVATDSSLSNEVYRVDGLTLNEVTIPAGTLSDCSTYYWGVEATLAGNSRSASPFARIFSTGLPADLNADGLVDTADLGGLIGAFGGISAFADINGDGVTDTADLGILITSFGDACSP